MTACASKCPREKAGFDQPPTTFPMKRPAACIPTPNEDTKNTKVTAYNANEFTADNAEKFKEQPWSRNSSCTGIGPPNRSRPGSWTTSF